MGLNDGGVTCVEDAALGAAVGVKLNTVSSLAACKGLVGDGHLLLSAHVGLRLAFRSACRGAAVNLMSVATLALGKAMVGTAHRLAVSSLLGVPLTVAVHVVLVLTLVSHQTTGRQALRASLLLTTAALRVVDQLAIRTVDVHSVAVLPLHGRVGLVRVVAALSLVVALGVPANVLGVALLALGQGVVGPQAALLVRVLLAACADGGGALHADVVVLLLLLEGALRDACVATLGFRDVARAVAVELVSVCLDFTSETCDAHKLAVSVGLDGLCLVGSASSLGALDALIQPVAVQVDVARQLLGALALGGAVCALLLVGALVSLIHGTAVERLVGAELTGRGDLHGACHRHLLAVGCAVAVRCGARLTLHRVHLVGVLPLDGGELLVGGEGVLLPLGTLAATLGGVERGEVLDLLVRQLAAGGVVWGVLLEVAGVHADVGLLLHLTVAGGRVEHLSQVARLVVLEVLVRDAVRVSRERGSRGLGTRWRGSVGQVATVHALGTGHLRCAGEGGHYVVVFCLKMRKELKKVLRGEGDEEDGDEGEGIGGERMAMFLCRVFF